jgi:hypothetical protein
MWTFWKETGAVCSDLALSHVREDVDAWAGPFWAGFWGRTIGRQMSAGQPGCKRRDLNGRALECAHGHKGRGSQ